MKVAAFIPIKLNNERFPGKNIRRFNDGTPLIHLIEKALLDVDSINEVYVYCSDRSIEEYLLPGVKYCQRNPIFDKADAVINDMHASILDKAYADIYVIAHATSPFLKSETVGKGIDIVASGAYDSVSVGKKVQEFIWKNNEPYNFTRDYIPRTQDLDPIYIETNGMFVFSRQSMLESHCRIGKRPYMMELAEEETIDIDYYEDFCRAEIWYNAMKDFSEDRERSSCTLWDVFKK